VFDDGLDRGETGARGEQNNGFVRVFAQEETAVRAFDAQDFLFLHATKDVVGELAAGHVTDMQFHRRGFGLAVRCGRHGVAASAAVAQQEFDVLAGVVLEGVTRGQLQGQHHHVV